MLVNTNGRSPRILRASQSISSSEAPTCGAKSILLNHQQIGLGNARFTLARDLVAGRLADRGVRAAAGFHAHDAFGRQGRVHDEELGVWVRAVCEPFNWRLHAYCKMTDHYHFVVETAQTNLSKGMRQLKRVYTTSPHPQ
jgi:hypothetical protein